jgi:hypothetical protein
MDERRRGAWRPVVVPGEPAETRSKFCGVPWLIAGEETPACRECGRGLRLFVQLDLDAVPEELGGVFGSGVLQLFYCVGPELYERTGRFIEHFRPLLGLDQPSARDERRPTCVQDGAWAPFSDTASLVRVVPGRTLSPSTAPDRGASHSSGRPLGDREFPPWAIVGWEKFDDLPDPDDFELAGLVVSYDSKPPGTPWPSTASRTVTFRCDSVGVEATMAIDDLPVQDLARAAVKDKLAGWPHWVQRREYPDCPRCGAQMRLVFQLDSEDHVPFMLGDAGVGHITQCPTHHDVVAFGWACS